MVGMKRCRGFAVRVKTLAAISISLGLSLAACASTDEVAQDVVESSPETSAPPVDGDVATTSEVPDNATATTSTIAAAIPEASPLEGRTVVIDPGHNGANGSHAAEINRSVDAGGFQKACNTTGTAADGTTEAEINWSMANELRQQIEAVGATAILTRSDNDGWGPCIDERGAAAIQSGADVLISLHADGASSTAHGFHVIHPGPVPGYVDENVAARAESLAVAVRDALVDAGLDPATYLADGTGLHRRTDLGTLNRAGVPAIMLEAGNMHHAQDLADLRDPGWQAQVAEALTRALVDRLSEDAAGG